MKVAFQQFLVWSALILTLTLSLGCESKVSEKDAPSYSVPANQDEKVKSIDQFNEQVGKLQNQVSRVRGIIAEVQKAIQAKGNLNDFSLFDLIFQANSNVQSQMARFKGEQLYVAGHLRLASPLLSEDCQTFQYLVSSTDLNPLEEINYELGSCATAGATLPVIRANFKGSEINLTIDSSNARKLIPADFFRSQIPYCHFSGRDSDQVECKDVALGTSEALTWSADIQAQGLTEIEVRGVSKLTQKIIYKGTLKLTRTGQILNASFQGPLEPEEL